MKRRARRTKSRRRAVARRNPVRRARRPAAPAPRRYAPPARRRARRNPVGMMDTPAFRYGVAAVLGAVAGALVNAGTGDGLIGPLADMIPMDLQMSTVLGLAVLVVSAFVLKGKNRAYGIAFGVGALTPALATAAQAQLTDGGTRSNPVRTARKSLRRKGRTRNRKGGGRRSFSEASRSLDSMA